MALVNHAKKEINAKIVFFGAGQAGKATNLNFIFKKLKPDFRGQFKSMNVQGSRMLFFDFLPSGQGKLNDYAVRFHIYTVQGEVPQDSTWKMVLKGADGVVFVADASSARQADNRTGLERLQACLRGHGLSTDTLPIIVQCNKSDLADAVSLDELQKSLGLGGVAFMKAVAGSGEGVLESLFTLVKMVLKRLRESGLELAGESVEGQAATEAEAVTAVEQSSPVPVGTLPAVDADSFAAPEQAPTENLAPTVEVLEGARLGDDGRLQIPLSVSCGGMSRRVTLSLAITLQAD